MKQKRLVVTLNPLLKKALKDSANENKCSMGEIIRISLYKELNKQISTGGTND
jgi:hypothetical protein